MAEYIDKAKIPWAKVDHPEGDLWDRVVFKRSINAMPPAEVVERSEYEALLKENHELAIKYDNAMNRVADGLEEISRLRSKVDKAIEEITNLRKQYPNDDYYDCKWEILGILKSNIGE